MSFAQRLAGVTRRGRAGGVVHVVDANPLNWHYVTYHTVEELVRVTKQGKMRQAAMRRYRWLDDRILEVHVRRDERFPRRRAAHGGVGQAGVR